MKRLEKLMFTIGLIDKTKGPASRVMATIDKVNQRTQQGIRQSAIGAAGLVGAGYALQSALSPAIEMDRALGEVNSLDISEKALKNLKNTALDFSVAYGESAADFVKASYDIQSAIAGLKGDELAKFTESSAILAKATKSDTGTITNYMGTMYGIFKNDAEKMGNANWVQVVAGQTATAVQMFKTTGQEMAAAFGSVGAEATAHGVKMSEQMAILGTLQATMSGSEAGTKYKAFLGGLGKAQKALGLEFTDSTGRMLSMPVILQKIKDKYGNIDTVAKSDVFQKAFGRKEAVGLIKLLMQDMDGLSGSMRKLGKTTGMDKAVEMAQKQVDPWQKAGAAIKGVSIAFGSILLPVLTPVLDAITAGNQKVIEWTRMFPNLAKVVGLVTLAVFGLVGAMAALAVIGGIATLIGAAFTLIASPIFLIIAAVVVGVGLIGYAIYALITHWDAIKAKTGEWAAKIIAPFKKIPAYFVELKNWFKSLDLFAFLDFGVLDKVASVLGFADKEKAQIKQSLPTLEEQVTADINAGGISQQLTNSVSNSRNIGDVIIHTTQKPDGHFIHDELEALAT